MTSAGKDAWMNQSNILPAATTTAIAVDLKELMDALAGLPSELTARLAVPLRRLSELLGSFFAAVADAPA
jgi:hypothetical protein